jgi:hypothetical protein
MELHIHRGVIGKGNHSLEMRFTVDMEPVELTILSDSKLDERVVKRKNNFQYLHDTVCDCIGKRKRIICTNFNHLVPTFDFKEDNEVEEFLYQDSFNRYYYTYTEVRNVLKFWHTIKTYFDDAVDLDRKVDNDHKSMTFGQMGYVKDHLYKQGIIHKYTNWFEIHNKTLDRFIDKLVS